MVADVIEREYQYSISACKSISEKISFYRDKLYVKLLPGLDGSRQSFAEYVGPCGEIIREMSELHSKFGVGFNPDFEIHLLAQWLRRNQSLNFSGLTTKELSAKLAEPIYQYCRNHIDPIMGSDIEKLIDQTPWSYNN